MSSGRAFSHGKGSKSRLEHSAPGTFVRLLSTYHAFSVQQQELDDLKASIELAERARRRDVAEKQEELDAQAELVGQQAATIDMLRRQLAAAQSGSENSELKQSDDEEKGLLSKGSPARASVWRRHAAIIALVVGFVLGLSLGRS